MCSYFLPFGTLCKFNNIRCRTSSFVSVYFVIFYAVSKQETNRAQAHRSHKENLGRSSFLTPLNMNTSFVRIRLRRCQRMSTRTCFGGPLTKWHDIHHIEAGLVLADTPANNSAQLNQVVRTQPGRCNLSRGSQLLVATGNLWPSESATDSRHHQYLLEPKSTARVLV